jgi:DNA-binding MarR family transcriptional regulator
MTTADPSMLLDNQICFLVYRLNRGISDQYRPILNELGITYPQYLVMLVLWEAEPMTVGQIGARLHLDSGTLSPLLKRLESAGLIERNRARHDERTVLVGLTKGGRALREKARSATADLEGCLADSRQDARALHALMSSLVARIDETSAR